MKQNKVASNLQQNYTEAEKAQARRNIGLADVAHSGDYNDLINKPVPINGQVQSDWNQTNEMMPDFIRNKPTIGDAVLTIRKNGSDVQTFSANSTTDKVADIAVPTKVSELQNDAGYITSSALPTVNDATLTIQKNGSTVQTFTANSSSNKTANIEVPTKTSDLQNDSGFITSSAIPAVNNATLTIQKNGSTVQTFTANSSSNKTANIEVPTKTSDLQNDSGFITSSAIPAVNNGTLTIQKNGTTVQTFTANSSSNKTANIEVPTKTSELQNDSGFITSSSVGNGTITIQKNGSTVNTFTTNQSSNKTVNIAVPTKTSDITNDSGFITLSDVPACNLYVAEYDVSTFDEVLAAYNAGKGIILTGANFGSNIHTQMLMYDFNTTSGQTRKFQFAPTVVPRVAAYYKYYATLDETSGWSKNYFSNTVPTKCGGIFQLAADETVHNLIEHRGWLCNNIFNFDLKYFCSANACTIYLAFVDQPFHVDVVGMRRGIRNDRMVSIDQTTTVQTLVRDIDVSTRIIMTNQPLNATEQRINIASLGPQEIVNWDYDVYWDLDLIFTQWGVTGSTSPCYHLHLEKFGQPSAGHGYLFATLTGSDLY